MFTSRHGITYKNLNFYPNIRLFDEQAVLFRNPIFYFKSGFKMYLWTERFDSKI